MSSNEAQVIRSIGIIEMDVHNDVLWVWSFPSVSADMRDILLRKCCLTQHHGSLLHTFVFGQFRRMWYYITTVDVQEPTALEKVTRFSVVLTAADFHPEKYAAFSRILCRIYTRHGSPVKIMESYISVLTSGVCQSDENGSFIIRDYEINTAYLAGSIKDVVSQFGMETVILYTALMLKKRIVVYHPCIESVLEFTRILPALTWHRKDWSILHPYVHCNETELEVLKSNTGYVAGFVDGDVSNKPDLFDVFVNLPGSEIVISHHAKEWLAMGKLHRDIGQIIVQSAQDSDRTETQVIKDISVKTKEVLESLLSLSERGNKLTLEMLRRHHFPPATENFLFHLAAAERLLHI